MYKQELLGGILMDEKFKTKEELYTMVCFDMTENIRNLIKEYENGNN